MSAPECRLWTEPDGVDVTSGRAGSGRFAALVRKAPTRAVDAASEDVAGLVSWPGSACALLVADGVGGGSNGDLAARLTITTVAERLAATEGDGAAMRAAVLSAVETANQELLARHAGSATTILAAVVDGRELRTCHAGDSELLVVGQRGRIKHQTVSHSPVGYGVEAGLIGQDEGLEHADRHLLSSCVGMAAMRVEVASAITLAVRDTVVLASDGLWDNLHLAEVAEIVRKGPLDRAVEQLAVRCAARMNGDDPEVAGKPDDLAILLYRSI